MSDAARNLTGDWHGIFNYPHDWPSNSFEAVLRERGGILTGETREPSDGIDDIAPEQTAFLEGTRSGSHVRFVKRYDEIHRDVVHYDGEVNGDATEITGHWTITGAGSGSFIMVRPRANEAEQVMEDVVTLERGVG